VWKSGFDYTDIVKCDGDFFLKSSSRDSISEYQISSDNPQKDNFHNLIFSIDKRFIFPIIIPTPLIKPSLPKRGWLTEKDL
jgi:hypothetical protein